MEDINSWIVFLGVGAVAGWIGGQVIKGSGLGLVGNIVVGVIGGFIGGYLFDLLDIETPNNLVGSVITSAAGAIVLLWIAGLVKK